MTLSKSILTDCTDANATLRLQGRVAALTGRMPVVCDLPRLGAGYVAGLTLADALMAASTTLGRHQRGVTFVVNAAPRDGEHPNGVPFGYFWHKPDPDCRQCTPHLVVTTVDRDVLMPVRHRLGVSTIHVMDVEEVMKAAASASWTLGLTENDIRMVADTQFRSLWFATLAAVWLDEGWALPSTEHEIPAFDGSTPFVVRVVDNFGNIKLEETPDELGWQIGWKFRVKKAGDFGDGRVIEYCERLANVGFHRTGFVRGSGGTLELVVGMGDAAETLGLVVGDVLAITRVR